MVDLQAIVAFNAAAIILLAIILLNARHTFHLEPLDGRLFRFMVFCTIAQAVIETVSFFTTEKIFPGSYCFNLIITDLLFINNALFSFFWVLYVDAKLFGDLKRLKKRFFIIGIPAMLVITGSLVNLICPVFFSINSETIEYVRTDLYFVPFISSSFYLICGLVLTIIYKTKNNRYLFFPALTFIIPICIANLTEYLFYGLNVLWIGSAISLTAIYISLQNQVVYTDSLSGVYTRQYMTACIQTQIEKKSSAEKMAGIMIDINKFKSINDTYGHVVGDNAIRETGKILLNGVSKEGKVFRYGGDEFVIIQLVKDEEQIKETIENIRVMVQKFNNGQQDFYQMSFAIGYTIFDIESDTFDSFLERMDQAMYFEKEGRGHNTFTCENSSLSESTLKARSNAGSFSNNEKGI